MALRGPRKPDSEAADPIRRPPARSIRSYIVAYIPPTGFAELKSGLFVPPDRFAALLDQNMVPPSTFAARLDQIIVPPN